MAWRFKASKYKNATPLVPKPEACIRDISVGSYQTYGNNIAASAAFMAFNVDHNGSSLAVLPIEDCGRKSKLMPLLHGHSDTVTDMDFSPFHDGLLATGSQDCLVKLWAIPPNGLEENMTEAEATLYHKQRRIETVTFHPTADCLLTTTSFTTLHLWDILAEQELIANSTHPDVIQSVSWNKNGSVLATSCKDKQVRVVDMRLKGDSIVTLSANSHQNIKDSRVVWLGDQDSIITTGFTAARQRELFLRDLRNFKEPLTSLTFDSSTGILIPLYDQDTHMMFLAGKGDTTISCLDVNSRSPYLIDGIKHFGEQTKGACLVYKRALHVMQGEVNRLLQLTSSSVIPIMYRVPRKSYREFHDDLFPETAGCNPQIGAVQWWAGQDADVPYISLDPGKHESGLSGENGTWKNKIEPRLGPKPFTPPKLNYKGSSESEKVASDFSFDNVFSVPSVPVNQEVVNGSNNHSINTQSNKPNMNDKNDENDSQQIESGLKSSVLESPTSVEEAAKGFSDDFSSLSLNEKNLIEYDGHLEKEGFQISSGDVESSSDSPNLNSPLNSKPKTPTTAERRKLFEFTNPNPEESAILVPEGVSLSKVEDEDKLEDFERASLQRSSIAERRRLYESRSMSVQEDKKGIVSPTPLRRKDSLKEGVREDEELSPSRPVPMQRQHSLEQPIQQDAKKDTSVTTPTPKRTSTVFGRVSKFRHLKGTPLHKSTHIENIRNVSRQISGECDGFHANPKHVAVPLSGAGGKIAIFDLDKTGKLPDGVIPTLVHGTTVMDFAWDPFNFDRFAVGCDDGIIRIWVIPEGGLQEPTSVPDMDLPSHSEKIYFIKFHNLATDVLASASYDLTIRIWHLVSRQSIILCEHTDQIFSMAWSPCGAFAASACRDGKLRVYEPRVNTSPIREGTGPVGSRGARVVWALDGMFIIVLGFDKVSERQIQIFRANKLDKPLNTVGLDVSPAILIPFYDEDSSTLFLTGKGDSTIYAFEVTEEEPYLCPLSHHRCNTLHQGLSFLPKNVCDVANVEFARALRLTNNTIEPLSFTVPRIKTELFQDDLFPPTKVTWRPVMTADQWFNGGKGLPKRISLKPDDMDCLTALQVSSTANSDKQGPKSSGPGSFAGSQQPFNRLGWNADMSGATREKQVEIQKAVSSRMEVNLALEQDTMEGVDDTEWDE